MASLFHACHFLTSNEDPLWERACSRRGHNTRYKYRLKVRFREQARSHI